MRLLSYYSLEILFYRMLHPVLTNEINVYRINCKFEHLPFEREICSAQNGIIT